MGLRVWQGSSVPSDLCTDEAVTDALHHRAGRGGEGEEAIP